MVEILQNFEQTVARFDSLILTGTGWTFLAAGLFIWLGGLDYRKALAAVIGAVAGAICAFFIADPFM